MAGNRIKTKRGPFVEYIYTLKQIEDNKRASVLIKILQQQKVKFSLGDISKIY